MGKRILTVLIVLAFAAPACTALVSSARLHLDAPPVAAPRPVIRAADAPAVPLRDPVAHVLSGIDRVLEAVKRPENALAVLLDVERPEEVREREERLMRRREAARIVHVG
jgi:hypothetical protein